MIKKVAVFSFLFCLVLLSMSAFALETCLPRLDFVKNSAAESYTFDGLPAINLAKYASCGWQVGQSTTIWAIDSTNPQDVKNRPLLKILMKKVYVDLLTSWMDNDAWDFEVTLFDSASQPVKVTIPLWRVWEWKGERSGTPQTQMDMLLPDGTKAFRIVLKMDSDATWDGQLDGLWVAPFDDMTKILQKIDGFSPVPGTSGNVKVDFSNWVTVLSGRSVSNPLETIKNKLTVTEDGATAPVSTSILPGTNFIVLNNVIVGKRYRLIVARIDVGGGLSTDTGNGLSVPIAANHLMPATR